MNEKQPVGPKAKKALGPQIEITRNSGNIDPIASSHLETAGKSLISPGLKYEGSACIHFYSGTVDRKEFAFKSQINMKDLSENIANVGTQQFIMDVMQYYGKVQKLRK